MANHRWLDCALKVVRLCGLHSVGLHQVVVTIVGENWSFHVLCTLVAIHVTKADLWSLVGPQGTFNNER